MKKITLIFLLCIYLFSAKSILAQDFPFDKYKTRTLSELVEIEREATKTTYEGKGLLIDAKPFYSAVRVKFIGTSRAISSEKKNLLKMWQGSLGYDAEILSLYENEYLFKECDKEYWIPVQKQVAAYFPKELKSGDMITIYLMVVGGVKLEKDWDFVFLINEFQKYQD
ncbi:MAG: hypothetical protein K1X72_21410 [Pyrinomonadaceae bacterium]|nr:hypothetical protein [Pyrinomonadaceae bacterium]